MIARLQVDFAGSQLCLGHDVFGSLPALPWKASCLFLEPLGRGGEDRGKRNPALRICFQTFLIFPPWKMLYYVFQILVKDGALIH